MKQSNTDSNNGDDEDTKKIQRDVKPEIQKPDTRNEPKQVVSTNSQKTIIKPKTKATHPKVKI